MQAKNITKWALGGMDHVDMLMQLDIGRIKVVGPGLLEDSVARR
jgi:hypothetical protein